MATRMLQRRGTAAEWAAQNPVLSSGEMGFETDTKVVKLGDGVTPWNDLESPYLYRSGGDMTGPLGLVEPTEPDHAVRVLDLIEGYLALSGGELTGPLVLPETEEPAPDHAARLADLAEYVPLSGGEMTGPLTVAAPTEPNHAARYIDINDPEEKMRQLDILIAQNLRLWQLEANVVSTTEQMLGWQGEAFLGNQKELLSNTGLALRRSLTFADGFAGLREGNLDVWDRHGVGPNHISSIAWNGEIFVAIGSAGNVWSSTDLISFTKRTIGASTATLNRVIWANNLFVIVGQGEIWTSPNGITWTQRASGLQNVTDVTWSGSLFVACANNNAMYSSSDGITWTSGGTGTTSHLNSIAWSPTLGMFVVVGTGGTGAIILTSTTGTGSWTSRSTPGGSTTTPNHVTWANGFFVAVGASGIIWTSDNGTGWTARTNPAGTSNGLQHVVWTGKQFFAVGANSTLLTSPTGVTWTQRTLGVASLSLTKNIVVAAGHIYFAVNATAVIYAAVEGSETTGTITLKTVTLPATANTVYLLTDANYDTGVTVLYEATLNGGTTWQAIVEGQMTELSHSGTQFAIRVTLTRASASNEATVRWMLAYAS